MADTPAIRIYTTNTCGYCAAALRLLKDKGVAFEQIDVSRDQEKRQEMMALSGRQTVPQIFIDAKPVGGYDDIALLDASGELDSLLGLK